MRLIALMLCISLCFAAYAQPASRHEVVIDEILADPSPPVQLPNAEFIELKNVSRRSFNLSGWKLSTSTASSGAFPLYNLQPDSFLILTSTSNVALFSASGSVLGIPSFPSLDNDGSVITITSKEGVIIHAVEYDKNWFSNDLKREGGWSLEMIDVHNPCGPTNWKESSSTTGGTPGKRNAVDGVNPDQDPPILKRSYATDSVTVIAVFNESLDSAMLTGPGNYSIDGMTVQSAKPVLPLFNKVQLKLSQPLLKKKVYELSVSNLKDCAGNSIGIYNKAKCGIAETPLINDMVVNEILFNPLPPCSDYVEVFNRSKTIFNLSKIYIANRSSAGALANMKKLSEQDWFFYPGEYLVLATDANALKKQYLVKDPNTILELSTMPSFPDDQGDVVIVNGNGEVTDEVNYSEDWHFPLITNAEGVSLERIDPDGNSNSGNWHSASSSSGFGTPGYLNSQYRANLATGAVFSFSSKIISPDNDGWQDYLTINYKMERPGSVASIRIFNAAGILVKELANNALLGSEGKFNWNGLGESDQKLPVGIYIIQIGVFRVDGKKMSFKYAIVVAGRK
jgi:hypothetical protein